MTIFGELWLPFGDAMEKNPPAFYPRACEEVFDTGTSEGSIDTRSLIEESNCTIMAEIPCAASALWYGIEG